MNTMQKETTIYDVAFMFTLKQLYSGFLTFMHPRSSNRDVGKRTSSNEKADCNSSAFFTKQIICWNNKFVSTGIWSVFTFRLELLQPSEVTRLFLFSCQFLKSPPTIPDCLNQFEMRHGNSQSCYQQSHWQCTRFLLLLETESLVTSKSWTCTNQSRTSRATLGLNAAAVSLGN